VIPTLLVVGCVLGRWWKITVPVAAIGWTVMIATTQPHPDASLLVGAAAFAIVNVAVGVLLFHGFGIVIRAIRARPSSAN
jgi:hypothetical protein